MESHNGSSHSDTKTLKRISPTNSTKTGLTEGINIEKEVEDKSSESWSQRDLNKVKVETTGKTDGEKSVGISSLNKSEKLVNNIKNTVGKLSGKRSSSYSILMEEEIKMKGYQKSLGSCSCSNLLEISNTEDKSKILSFERCFSSSYAKIENKNDEQISESSSLSTLMEFKQVLNTESTGEETSNRSECVLPRDGASISLISLQDEAQKGFAYDRNTVALRSKSGSTQDLFERFNEQLNDRSSSNTPVKFKQVLNTKSTVEKTSDRNESVFPGVGASISSTSSQDEDLRCCTYDPNTVDKRRKSVSNKDLLERFTERPRTAGHFHDRAVTVAAIQHAAGGESSGSQNSDLYLGPCPTPQNSLEESDSYEAVSANIDNVESLNDIQEPYSDLFPIPHDSVEESDPYEEFSVNGDEVEGLHDTQECYEKLRRFADGQVVRMCFFICLCSLFFVASIIMISHDPSLSPYPLTFIILGAFCLTLVCFDFKSLYRRWMLSNER